MQGLIDHIRSSPKCTPVKVYLWENTPVTFPNCHVFYGHTGCKLIFGDWKDIAPVLQENRSAITHMHIECDRCNSALPLLSLQEQSARIEPGAVIREQVRLGKNAVIMMGAVLNIGAEVGAGSMVDMNAVLGGRAIVGKNCHIGAGAVLAGVIEPASAKPVVVEDQVMIGANGVILEGCRVGQGAVVAAGSVVTEDVPPNAVVAGCPAKIVKWKDERTVKKTALVDALREF